MGRGRDRGLEHGERKRLRIGTWGEEEIEDWNMGRGRD